jgi:hypothetical protein
MSEDEHTVGFVKFVMNPIPAQGLEKWLSMDYQKKKLPVNVSRAIPCV